MAADYPSRMAMPLSGAAALPGLPGVRIRPGNRVAVDPSDTLADTTSVEEEAESRSERSARKRELIMDAAAIEFDLHGVASASTVEIAARAEVTRSALIHHFKTKEEIAAQLASRKNDVWPGIVAEVRGDGLRGLDAIAEVSRRMAGQIRDNVRVRAALRIMREFNQGQPMTEPWRRWEETVVAFLQQAIADHEVPDTIDTAQEAAVLVWAAWGVITVATETGEAVQVEDRLTLLFGRLFGEWRSRPVG